MNGGLRRTPLPATKITNFEPYIDWSKNQHAYESADSSPAAGSIADMIGAWPCKKCGAAETDAMHAFPVSVKDV